jgi:hypothetical protein
MAKMSQYENYKTEGGTPYSAEEQATFESTGVVPVSGKYHDGDTDMVTKTIGLDEIISSGFPAHTQSDAGKVLGVRDDGELEWVEKLPPHDRSDTDKVLTVTGSHADDVEWVTPGGGGGGNIVIAKVVLQDAGDDSTLNFVSGTHTVKQIYDLINAGETVVNVQVTILYADNSISEIDMLSGCSIKPGMDIHDVFILGAAGSGSFSMDTNTAMLIGSWPDEGIEDGNWTNFNFTPINPPAAEPAGE